MRRSDYYRDDPYDRDDYRERSRDEYDRERRRARSYEDDYEDRRDRPDHERGWLDRAGDEVRSWFGDDDAERRRIRDHGVSEDDDRYIHGRRDRSADRHDRSDGPMSMAGRGAGYGVSGAGSWVSGAPARPHDYPPDDVAGFSQTGRSVRDDPSGRASTYRPPTNRRVGDAGPHVGKGPQNYKRSDERIAEDINERLLQHGYIDATMILVTVVDGVVDLTGTVNGKDEKYAAEDVVESVLGVRDVNNNLKVNRGVL